jgi:hypothetical protein
VTPEVPAIVPDDSAEVSMPSGMPGNDPTEPTPGYGLSPVQDSFDLGGGEISAASSADLQEGLKDLRDRRRMRGLAFLVLGVVCVVYFIALLLALNQIVTPELLAIVEMAKDWHVLLILGMGLFLLATVPLSLTLAIVKMISDKDDGKSKNELSITSPQLEIVKLIIEAAKSLKP